MESSILTVVPLLFVESFPAASWLGVIVSVALAFLAWLLKDTYADLKQKFINLKGDITVLEKKTEVELLAQDRRQDVFEKETNDRIHKLHLIILEKLEEIKDKYNKFRN